MGILSKLFTAVRGGATEVGQAIVDSQALRILDQEIRDSSAALSSTREELAKVMAQRKLAADKLKPLLAKQEEYEGYAEQALAKGDEALALEVATKIAEIENEMVEHQMQVDNYDSSIATMRKSIQEGEKTVARLRVQVDQVKATASVQRAQAVIAERHSGANRTISSAVDSLERIKQRQAETAARFEAAQELAQDGQDIDLKARLRQAGIVAEGNQANDVLARIRKKSGGGA